MGMMNKISGFVGGRARKIAPRTLANLRLLAQMQESGFAPDSLSHERAILALRREVDELRREIRKLTELYDEALMTIAGREPAARGVGSPEPGQAVAED